MRVFTYAVPGLAAAVAAAFALLAAPVEPLGNVDSNNDRKLSYQELTQAYPDVSRTLLPQWTSAGTVSWTGRNMTPPPQRAAWRHAGCRRRCYGIAWLQRGALWTATPVK